MGVSRLIILFIVVLFVSCLGYEILVFWIFAVWFDLFFIVVFGHFLTLVCLIDCFVGRLNLRFVVGLTAILGLLVDCVDLILYCFVDFVSVCLWCLCCFFDCVGFLGLLVVVMG